MAQAMIDMNLKQDQEMEWDNTESDDSDTSSENSILEIINTKNSKLKYDTCTTVDDDASDFVQIIKKTHNAERELLFQYKYNYVDMQFYLEFDHDSNNDVLMFLNQKCNYKAFDTLPFAKFSKAKQFFSIKTPQTLLKIDAKVCTKIKSRTQYYIDFGKGNVYIFTLEFDTVDNKYIFIQHEYHFIDENEYTKSVNILYDNFKMVTDAPYIQLPERTDKSKKKSVTAINNATMQAFEHRQLDLFNISNRDIKYDKKLTPDASILPINGKILNSDVFDSDDNCAHQITKIDHVQTRSADEQATAIIRCIDCGVRIE